MSVRSAVLAVFAALSTGCMSSGPQPTPEELMAAYGRAGTPGAEHRALDVFVGTWDCSLKMWMDPAAAPSESKGTMTNTWILGGRYLDQRFQGSVEGQSFEGLGLWGYDVAGQHYVGTWIDSMSTQLMVARGRASADGKQFRMLAVSTNPLTGRPDEGEEEIVVESPDRHTMTMWERRDGERVKTMEIVYTRVR